MLTPTDRLARACAFTSHHGSAHGARFRARMCRLMVAYTCMRHQLPAVPMHGAHAHAPAASPHPGTQPTPVQHLTTRRASRPSRVQPGSALRRMHAQRARDAPAASSAGCGARTPRTQTTDARQLTRSRKHAAAGSLELGASSPALAQPSTSREPSSPRPLLPLYRRSPPQVTSCCLPRATAARWGAPSACAQTRCWTTACLTSPSRWAAWRSGCALRALRSLCMLRGTCRVHRLPYAACAARWCHLEYRSWELSQESPAGPGSPCALPAHGSSHTLLPPRPPPPVPQAAEAAAEAPAKGAGGASGGVRQLTARWLELVAAPGGTIPCSRDGEPEESTSRWVPAVCDAC